MKKNLNSQAQNFNNGHLTNGNTHHQNGPESEQSSNAIGS